MKEQGYVDAYNDGLNNHDATRSLWICRFYDRDFLEGHVHPIEDHANELFQLVTQTIPNALAAQDVDVKNQDGTLRSDFSDLARALDGRAGVPHLIQNLLPAQGQRASDWIHRFVTFATPHGGIDFSNVPELLQQTIGTALNPLDGSMFQPTRMRQYLKLPDGAPLNSLNGTYPPEGACA
jgi:hypothetical protein